MIPRILVPKGVRLAAPDSARKPAARTSTYMDDRIVVPPAAELSDAPPLDGRTSIPAHLPLAVLAERILVPRDMPVKRMERPQPAGGSADSAVAVAVLDRVVVPAGAALNPRRLGAQTEDAEEAAFPEHPLEFTPELREVLDPDVFTTGDPNLLIEPAVKRSPRSDLVVRIASIAIHVLIVLLIIFGPNLFPAHRLSNQEIALSRQDYTNLYMPRIAPPPAPRLRINPRTLNRLAPSPKPVVPVLPQPQPPAPQPSPNLPEAPRPNLQSSAPRAMPPAPQPSPLSPIPAAPQPKSLVLPRFNGGTDSDLRGAIRHSGPRVYSAPSAGAQAPGSAGGPGMRPGVQILTPTDGVNFDPYLRRVLAVIQRNWYAIMPESAMMGDKGIVVTDFRINTDGSVPSSEPTLQRTSGKQPLDDAALASIRASNPFEPLPSQFKRPYIELRIIFFYNLLPDAYQ